MGAKAHTNLEVGSAYDWDMFKKDLSAGITVGVVVIPQGIAYAMLAELPPVWGLYGALMPLPIYAMLASSKHQSIGPFALVSIVIAETVTPVVAPEDQFGHHRHEYSAAVCLMSFMVGVMHLLMAWLKLDIVVVSFLSEPVLSGFTTASAILIAASQLKHVLGLPIPRAQLPQMLLYTYNNIYDANGSAIVFGVMGVLVLDWLKRLNKWLCPNLPIPEQLLLLTGAIIICYKLYDDVAEAPPSPEHGWTSHWGKLQASDSHFWPPRLVGVVPAGLPSPKVPPLFNLELVGQLLLPSLVVGLFAYILSMSIVRTMAIKYDYATDSNQELVAFGFANLAGAFFSAYPAAGSLRAPPSSPPHAGPRAPLCTACGLHSSSSSSWSPSPRVPHAAVRVPRLDRLCIGQEPARLARRAGCGSSTASTLFSGRSPSAAR